MKIIYELNGNVHVVVPNLGCGLTIEQIAAKDVPQGVPFQIVEDSEIPTSREHRNEWKLNGNKIEVDQAKVSLKLTRESDKANKKTVILNKLKITEDDAKEFLKI